MKISFNLIADISVQVDIFVDIGCSKVWSNWLFICLFKLIVHFLNQIDRSYFCSNCLFIFVFKLTSLFKRIGHIFVKNDRLFVQKALLICLFKLIFDIFVQNRVLIFLFKWIVVISVQNWLPIFLFKLIVNICFFYLILIFLFKLIVDISVQSDVFVQIGCS